MNSPTQPKRFSFRTCIESSVDAEDSQTAAKLVVEDLLSEGHAVVTLECFDEGGVNYLVNELVELAPLLASRGQTVQPVGIPDVPGERTNADVEKARTVLCVALLSNKAFNPEKPNVVKILATALGISEAEAKGLLSYAESLKSWT